MILQKLKEKAIKTDGGCKTKTLIEYVHDTGCANKEL